MVPGRKQYVWIVLLLLIVGGLAGSIILRGLDSETGIPVVPPKDCRQEKRKKIIVPMKGKRDGVTNESRRSSTLREKLQKELPPGYDLPKGEPRLDRDDEGNIYYVFPDHTFISPRVRPFTLPGGKVVWRKVIVSGGPMDKEKGVDPREWKFDGKKWVKKEGP